MSSASFGSQNSGERPKTAAETPPQASQAALKGLLERVMRQTLERSGTDEPLDAAEMQAFREVARRYRGQPLLLEPVAVELIEAVLDSFCPGTNNKTKRLRNMSLQIAQSMMDDPPALERLNAFWIRLNGGEL